VAEEAGGAERHPTAPHVIRRLGNRVYDEPKHAADFREETAAELAYALHDDNRVCRERLVAAVSSIHAGHAGGKLPQFIARERRKSAAHRAAAKGFDSANRRGLKSRARYQNPAAHACDERLAQ
jgi:hypothetical protein